MLQNQNVFGGSAVARGYATQSHLQPAEETILRLLLPHLPAARMLDLGVGGGRTTLHFAKWVREYVGTDYAAAMITECEQRFAGYPNHISFQVGDARAMPEFATVSFDFVLFSFNGIDCVSHEDRLQILKEIRRVGKPGGYFCFSSHNLNWAANLFELRRLICLNPKWAVRTAKRFGLRFLYNWGIKAATVRTAPYLIFNDGAHRRALQNYYVRPVEQLRQLRENYRELRVFSAITGCEITAAEELAHIEDSWLYYLCRFQ